MQIELYKHNSDRFIELSGRLKLTVTQLVNMVLENVEVEPRLEIQKVKMVFEKKMLDRKTITPVVVQTNFVDKWKD